MTNKYEVIEVMKDIGIMLTATQRLIITTLIGCFFSAVVFLYNQLEAKQAKLEAMHITLAQIEFMVQNNSKAMGEIKAHIQKIESAKIKDDKDDKDDCKNKKCNVDGFFKVHNTSQKITTKSKK